MSVARGGDLRLIRARLPSLDGDGGGLYRLEARQGVWTKVERQTPADDPPHGAGELRQSGRLADDDGLEKDGAIDCRGGIVLSGFVDLHMHLDKSHSLPFAGNDSGTLGEAIASYSAAYPGFTTDTLKARIRRTALDALSKGTTAIRSHLDFQARHGREAAFRTVHAALEVREELRDLIDLQFVLMTPSFGDTPEVWSWIEEALLLGVDGLGGAPHIAPNPKELTDRIFKLATKHGRFIDLHVDESDDPARDTALYLADKTMAEGYQGRVVAGHLCSLSAMEPGRAASIIARLAEAKIGAVTLPASNLYLQGREDVGLVRRGITRVRELIAAGVPVAAASDNIRDAFHPLGGGDLLQIGLLTAYAAHLGADRHLAELLRMLTQTPASLASLPGYGIEAGKEATFVRFEAPSFREALSCLPSRRFVYRKGRLLRRPSWEEEEQGEAEVGWANA